MACGLIILSKSDYRPNVIYKRLRTARPSAGIKGTVFIVAGFSKMGAERKKKKPTSKSQAEQVLSSHVWSVLLVRSCRRGFHF